MSTILLQQIINERHLLKHPFYKLWSEGKLNQDILSDYAAQYYKHVEAFPRYISLIHSKCDDLANRQILLENLIEEEQGQDNHPKLWRDFASELGVSENEVLTTRPYKKTEELVNEFFRLCEFSYASGLGALYAYENQTPAVSESKIEGLKKFYNITSEKALKFFEVHKGADIWHSEEVGSLIEKLPPEEKIIATESAKKATQLLWSFLDGMMQEHNLSCDHI